MKPLPERYQLRSQFMAGKEVYLVYDKETEQDIVLKRASRQEANTLAYLTRRNVATIPQFVDYDEKGHLLAMEYIDGQMLSSYSTPTLREVIVWAEQLFTIFAALSAVKVDYDDLNKNNVLINTSGELALVDFELARYKEDYSDSDQARNARRPLRLLLRLLEERLYSPGEQDFWRRISAWGNSQLTAIDSGEFVSAAILREQLRWLLP